MNYWFNVQNERWDLMKQFVQGKTIDLGSEETVCHKKVCPDALRVDIKGSPDLIHDLETKLPFNNDSYDTVVCGYILEHLYHPFEFLNECYRILKPNGHIIISIPNMSALPYFLNENKDMGVHIHAWNLPMLEHYMTKVGFKVIYKKKINAWYNLNILFRLLCRIVTNWKACIIMVGCK